MCKSVKILVFRSSMLPKGFKLKCTNTRIFPLLYTFCTSNVPMFPENVPMIPSKAIWGVEGVKMSEAQCPRVSHDAWMFCRMREIFPKCARVCRMRDSEASAWWGGVRTGPNACLTCVIREPFVSLWLWHRVLYEHVHKALYLTRLTYFVVLKTKYCEP